MERIVISGTGVFTPEESITNEELVEAYNKYAENYNLTNKNKIEHGELVALELSNEEFIFNASGIKNRYVMDKKGILDPEIMHPILEKRDDDNEEIAIRRFENYEKNIKPVIDFYKQSNLLKVVNGETSITEISHEISGLIEGI